MATLKEVTGKAESDLIKETLIDCNYNRSKAAKVLMIDRKTLYNKMTEHSLNRIGRKTSIIELEAERLEWSLKTFPDATPHSSLIKLTDEILEVEQCLLDPNNSIEDTTEEYADCLMCLFDSAGRAGILPKDIFVAFEKKLSKNKARVWKNNGNNTYSHVK